jgi:N-ethylmaleimide reductase
VSTIEALFDPTTIGTLPIPSRIVMAPMARARSGPDRAPRDIVAAYYAQRASAGLIVTEACHVSPFSVGRAGTSALHTGAQLAGWHGVTQAVHAAGGRIFVQLYHLGRKQHPSLLPQGMAPIAPSTVLAGGMAETANGLEPFCMPRALAIEEIPALVEAFRLSAVNARDAGFDGVEIHGANGYLVDQFLRDGANHRQDGYGGSMENRVRFLTEVVEAIGSVFPRSRIGLKVTPHYTADGIEDSDPRGLFTFVADRLARLGAGYFHVVEGAAAGGKDGPKTEDARLLPAIRAAFPGRLIANGGYDAQSAAAVLREGHADLVSFGALFIANPDLVSRFRAGAPMNPPDRPSFSTGGIAGYIDYPTLTETAPGALH